MPPFFTYKCPRCDAETTELRAMDDRERNLPICYNGDVPCTMEPVITPVAGYVRNPAAGPPARGPKGLPKRSKP